MLAVGRADQSHIAMRRLPIIDGAGLVLRSVFPFVCITIAAAQSPVSFFDCSATRKISRESRIRQHRLGRLTNMVALMDIQCVLHREYFAINTKGAPTDRRKSFRGWFR